MKILHIYKEYFPVVGGIENHIRVLAEAQVNSGHEVTVLVTNFGYRTTSKVINGVHVIFAGRWATIASVPISPALFFLGAKLKADIVHLHFPHPPGELVNLLFKPGRCTVITYHSDVVRQKKWLGLYKPILRTVLRRADKIITTSCQYQKISKFIGAVIDKCSVVSLGVNINKFNAYPKESIVETRNRLSLPIDKPLLLFVGKLRYYKGVDDLILAMKSVPDAYLIIVGSGPLEGELKSLVDKLNLDARVRFVGEVSDDDLVAYYGISTLFVLPSNAIAEAFGTVLLEAMAAGLPLITTELGTATSWVNQNELTGLIVPPKNPGKLAEAINRVINSPELYKTMSVAAKIRVSQEFSEQKMTSSVEDIYREVIAASARV